MNAIETSTPTLDQLRASDMTRQTYEYWFTEHGHVRSPFPFYIQDNVRENTLCAFRDWIAKLNPKAREEINGEIAHEKFEEILFQQAMALVKTDDEVLTLRFPFLPRVGDNIDGGGMEGREGGNIVRTRQLIAEGKDEFLQVKAKNTATGEMWDTRFELP
ncbi:MAG: hypothetical protein K9J06_15025 [Flavobacteriales bacterium]|nr:hypothetical protein [Flavobacteriales bacterium]